MQVSGSTGFGALAFRALAAFPDDALGAAGTLATFSGHPELILQGAHGMHALLDGFPDLTLRDGLADAHVHGDIRMKVTAAQYSINENDCQYVPVGWPSSPGIPVTRSRQGVQSGQGSRWQPGGWTRSRFWPTAVAHGQSIGEINAMSMQEGQLGWGIWQSSQHGA